MFFRLYNKSMNTLKKTRTSTAAKRGFKVEDLFVEHLSDDNSTFRKKLLIELGFQDEKIESIQATKPRGYLSNSFTNLKTDVALQIKTGSNISNLDSQNFSIKLVSAKDASGFNQLDKRWVDTYSKLFKIPEDVTFLLKLYTGEIGPDEYEFKPETIRDNRRLFLTEFLEKDQKLILDFFNKNLLKIIHTLFIGETNQFVPNWLIVIQNSNESIDSLEDSLFKLSPIYEAIQIFFGDGKVSITKQGNLKLGNMTMQRKGGDGGKKTANMLQFKINPNLAFS